MARPAIELDHLTREFPTVRAIDDLSFSVPAGTIFGFLGPNGSGKTTTIRLLLGLLEPTSGSARVLGHELPRDADRVRERGGALLEHSGLYERLSASDNLEFYARAWRLPRAERVQRIATLLRHVGLFERRDELVASWSRGMKQKLAVARALLHRPAILFLDEPTAGLDPVAAAALRDDLSRLAVAEGTTVFLTTHNLTEAERLCSLVAVIDRGRLLRIGSPDELRGTGQDTHLVIVGRGFSPELAAALRSRDEVRALSLADGTLTLDVRGGDTAPIVAAVAASGARIDEVRRGAATLEDAFLELVKERP